MSICSSSTRFNFFRSWLFIETVSIPKYFSHRKIDMKRSVLRIIHQIIVYQPSPVISTQFEGNFLFLLLFILQFFFAGDNPNVIVLIFLFRYFIPIFPSVHIHSQFHIGQTMGTEMKNAFFGKCFLPKKAHTRRNNFFSHRHRCFLRAIFESRRNTWCISRLSKEAMRKQIGCCGKKVVQERAKTKGEYEYEL